MPAKRKINTRRELYHKLVTLKLLVCIFQFQHERNLDLDLGLASCPYQDFDIRKGRTVENLKFPGMMKDLSHIVCFCCLKHDLF